MVETSPASPRRRPLGRLPTQKTKRCFVFFVPEHRAWEGLILPIDHPFWQTHFPPNGFRCRCAVLGVTQAEYDQLRRDGGQFAGGTVKFDNDVDADLEALDPGFAYNPGIPGSRAAALQRLAEEKAARAAVRAATIAAQGDSDQIAPSTTPKRTTTAPQPAPAPLVLTKRTDKTSIADAARDANPHYREIGKAKKEYKALQRELNTMPRGTAKEKSAYQAKQAEIDAAQRKYKRLLREYGSNCQRSVIAYELRRRGYDVTALPRLKDDDAVADLWRYVFGTDFEQVNGADEKIALSALEEKIASYGDGSRSIIVVKWKDDCQHAFIAERQNGKIVYVDPQSGKVDYASWKRKFDPSAVLVSRIKDEPHDATYLRWMVKEAK